MSPCFIRRLTPAGLEAVDYTADSLAEATQYEPDDGIYTVANTFNVYQTLKLDAHLDRMEDSAHHAGIPLVLERDRLKTALKGMIEQAGYGDVRFRLTVPRDKPGEIIISLEPFTPLSEEFILAGVRCVTVPNSARQNAAAKTTDWMHARTAIKQNMPDDTYEAILLNEQDELLEGLGSNFYAIHNGQLRTAAAGVLPGIAQQIVFEVAPPIVEIRREPVTKGDIPRLAEAFMTSSSRGVVPIVQLDDHTIGDGKPGKITLALHEAYIAWLADHLEML